MPKKTFINCPKCEGRIELSFEDLLYRNHITCPDCKLTIYFNIPQNVRNSIKEDTEPTVLRKFSEPDKVAEPKNLSSFITSVEAQRID